MKSMIFYLGMGTLFTHELDAMANHEWRVIPLLNWLPDSYGMNVFLLLHIPLFAILVSLVASSNPTLRFRSRLGISLFLVIHALLHLLFIGSIGYEFVSAWSNSLIFGGALLGFLYLVIEFMEHQYST
jgi:hypothetical protein